MHRGEREILDPMPGHTDIEHEHDDEHAEQIALNEQNDHEHPRITTSAVRRSYDSGDSSSRGEREEQDMVTSPLMESHRDHRDSQLSHHSGHSGESGETGELDSIEREHTYDPVPSSPVPSEDAPPYIENADPPTGFSNVSLNDEPSATPAPITSAPAPVQSTAPAPNASNERPANGSSGRRFPLRPMPNLRSLFTRTPSDSNNNNANANGSNRTLASSSSRQHLLSHQRSTSTFSNSSSMLHLTPTTSHLSSRHAHSHSNHYDRSMNASSISLASISAPLQHTLTKTEFNYPKNGPSQEQMKFLGSRESLALFGVPFGSAAVAYSRVDPPPFPVEEGSSGASGSNETATVNADEGDGSVDHQQEATDETVIPSPSTANHLLEEDASEINVGGKGKEREVDDEILVRRDSLAARRQTASSSLTSGTRSETMTSFSLSPGDMDHDVDSEKGSPVIDGETAGGISPSSTSKMVIPITNVREPSPGPPTPPPTPPRTTANLTGEGTGTTPTAVVAASS